MKTKIPDGFDATAPRPLAVRIADACRMTGMGKTKLYALIGSGDIAAVKIGRITLIRVSSLEALLDRNSKGRLDR